MRLTLATSLLIFLVPAVVLAERLYDELEWSSANCKELGYEGVFDKCAIIEFCEGLEHGRTADRHALRKRRDRRHLRGKGGGEVDRNLGLFGGHSKEKTQTTPETVEDKQESSSKEKPPTTKSTKKTTNKDKTPPTKESATASTSTTSEEQETDSVMTYSPPPDDLSYADVPLEDEIDIYGGSDSAPKSAANQDDEFQKEVEFAEDEEGYEYAIADYGWRIPGKECLTPGPTIRLDRGQSHGLFVKGSGTQEKTNLHSHGLHIAGSGNADDTLRETSGDDIIIYNLTIPDYHMGGTFWYHSHHHGSVNKQVSGGAYGMMIVNDGDNIGTDDDNVLSFLQNERKLIIHGTKDSDFSANGVTTGVDTYELNSNEWYRLRILMVTIDDHHIGGIIEFPESCTVHSVAHDGIFRFQVPSPEPRQRFGMTTASRLDVAIKCTGNGVITVGSRADTVAKITTKMASSSANKDATPFENGETSWSSTRPPYLQDLSEKNVDHFWLMKMDSTAINGQQYSHGQPLCGENDMDFLYGSVQEWSLRGVASHPFHLHTYPMQIISEGCSDDHHDKGEYYDTIMGASYMQLDKLGRKAKCKIRTVLRDVAGKAVLHCHITKHEDMGAMGYINVVGEDAPVQPAEPRVHTCNGSTKDTAECDLVQTVETCGMEGISVSQDEPSD